MNGLIHSRQLMEIGNNAVEGRSYSAASAVGSSPRSATLHQLASARELTLHRTPKPKAYQDAVGDLCEKTVSMALDVPLAALRARTRQTKDIALARQIAMYLCHTVFSVPHTDVGIHFSRDRTTVAHACALVEDKRDEMEFDLTLCQLEALLGDAREAAEIVSHNAFAEEHVR